MQQEYKGSLRLHTVSSLAYPWENKAQLEELILILLRRGMPLASSKGDDYLPIDALRDSINEPLVGPQLTEVTLSLLYDRLDDRNLTFERAQELSGLLELMHHSTSSKDVEGTLRERVLQWAYPDNILSSLFLSVENAKAPGGLCELGYLVPMILIKEDKFVDKELTYSFAYTYMCKTKERYAVLASLRCFEVIGALTLDNEEIARAIFHAEERIPKLDIDVYTFSQHLAFEHFPRILKTNFISEQAYRRCQEEGSYTDGDNYSETGKPLLVFPEKYFREINRTGITTSDVNL